MAQLTIRFIGLAALVPPREQGDHWLSVLPNLRHGASADAHEAPYDVPPHQALVAVRSRELDTTCTELSAKLRVTLAAPALNRMLPAGDELVFFEPQAEVISLTSGVPGLEVENQAPAGFGTRRANDGEASNLCWVPPLEMISKDYSHFDRGLLADDRAGRKVRPADERLAATFVLDRGRLAATGVIRAAGQAALYEFRGKDGAASNWEQSLATGYELRVTVDAEVAVLVFEDAGGNRRRLTLRGPDIDVWVTNRELEELLSFTNLSQATGPDPSGDIDFACFYTMAEGFDPTNHAAIRIPYVATAGAGGLIKPCGAPQFAD